MGVSGGFRASGLEVCSGFRVQLGLKGFEVRSPGLRLQRSRVKGLGFRV